MAAVTIAYAPASETAATSTESPVPWSSTATTRPHVHSPVATCITSHLYVAGGSPPNRNCRACSSTNGTSAESCGTMPTNHASGMAAARAAKAGVERTEQEKKDLDVPKLQARIRQLEDQLKAKAKKRKSREGQIHQRAKFAELDKQSKNSENQPPASQKRQKVVG